MAEREGNIKPEMMVGVPVHEVVLEPKVGVGVISMEGHTFPLLRIEHPRYGEIVILMKSDTCLSIGVELTNMIIALRQRDDPNFKPPTNLQVN